MGERMCKVLCIKDFQRSFEKVPFFSKGEIYSCEHYSSDGYLYMKVERKDGKYTNASNLEVRNLNSYFVDIKDCFELDYYEKANKTFIRKIIEKFTSKVFEEYRKAICPYKNIDCELFRKTYEIFEKIEKLELSQFYRYHQDKIKYILDSIFKLHKATNEEDFNKHLEDCKELLNKIEKAVNIAEDKAKQKDETNKKQMMEQYSEKKEKLFKLWDNELKDIWEVE